MKVCLAFLPLFVQAYVLNPPRNGKDILAISYNLIATFPSPELSGQNQCHTNLSNRKRNYSNICNRSDREFHSKTDKERHKRLMSSLPVFHCWASKGPHGTPLVLFSGETEGWDMSKNNTQRWKK